MECSRVGVLMNTKGCGMTLKDAWAKLLNPAEIILRNSIIVSLKRLEAVLRKREQFSLVLRDST